jgi:hypothetical protein
VSTTTTTAPELGLTPAELGARGRTRSVQSCTPEQADAALRAIADVEPGTEFSVNLVRDQLDAAGVPAAPRAGLFDRAVAAELIEPVNAVAGHRILAVTEPSTGRSARGARVRVYRRTTTPYRATAA